jgi:hypothetical protein
VAYNSLVRGHRRWDYTKESEPVGEIDGKRLWETLAHDLEKVVEWFSLDYFRGESNTIHGNRRTIAALAGRWYPSSVQTVETDFGRFQVEEDDELSDGRLIVTRTVTDFTIPVDKTDWEEVGKKLREIWNWPAETWCSIPKDAQYDYIKGAKAAVAEYKRQEAANE